MLAQIDPVIAQVLLPVAIFVARICDVTVGTLRIIAVARGRRVAAAILGFFEVLIWITVISHVMQNLTNPWCYVAYAAGFATGNYVGIQIEQMLAMGQLVVRVITRRPAGPLIEALHGHGFGVTSVPAMGKKGAVSIIYSVVPRSDLEHVISLIRQFHPKAFMSVEDVRLVREGVFPTRRPLFEGGLLRRWLQRKGK